MKKIRFLFNLVLLFFVSASQCGGGSYYNDYGQLEHSICPAGKYAPQKKCEYDSNPCQVCPYGKFQNKTGQLSCREMLDNNCSVSERTGLIEGAQQDGCVYCENDLFSYIYDDGLCKKCHERYEWTKLNTNHTSCERRYPFDSVIFKILFSLSILFVSLSSYFFDNMRFDRWCVLLGMTFIIVVMTLVYYETDITSLNTWKWLVIGFLIELLLVAIYIVMRTTCNIYNTNNEPAGDNTNPAGDNTSDTNPAGDNTSDTNLTKKPYSNHSPDEIVIFD